MDLVSNHLQINPDVQIPGLWHQATYPHQIFEIASPGPTFEKFY
jgi:hypothetical protein